MFLLCTAAAPAPARTRKKSLKGVVRLFIDTEVAYVLFQIISGFRFACLITPPPRPSPRTDGYAYVRTVAPHSTHAGSHWRTSANRRCGRDTKGRRDPHAENHVHHHSMHACTHLRSEVERAPWGRCCRALLPRRQAPEASREDGTDHVAMGRALSQTPTVRHRSDVPKPSQAAGCSRSHVAASSLASSEQSSIEALATIE